MPAQLRFSFGLLVEVPIAYVTWRDGAGVRHERIVYPHCIDLDWRAWRCLNGAQSVLEW